MSAYGSSNQPHSRSQTPIPDIARSSSYASQRPRTAETAGTGGANSTRSNDGDARSIDGSTRGSIGDLPSRQPSTLKKRNSFRRSSSLKRSGSRSRRSTVGEMDSDNPNSAFHSPVPSHGNPTEILANRFTGWRRILKDYIAYFKEVQIAYEAQAKTTNRLFHTLNSAIEPEMFLRSGGILETNVVLKEHHKSSMLASEQAKQIQIQIISSLSGLRNDLSGKIKEIKALSGDFKNTLDKEREGTRRAVTQLADALSAVDANPSLASGKNDPYIVKLGVDKQLRRQLAEENYLHRAYLNLESSGRELESIVVSEIQKAFESYMNILRMEGADLTDTAERLQTRTINLPADHEWSCFVERDPDFVDPRIPVRSFDVVEYPGWNHPAAVEVRAGLLERKSKYLKSYTPGWYVLSPSHLHEFKTPDRNHDMTPVMSLYLPDCTMGSHTQVSASSHKFIVKGRQTGALHRGHSWVFRAETHDAMIGFYEDIKKLIELSGPERNAFVASHQKQHTPTDGPPAKETGSSSSENGLENDEADEIPYSADRSALIGSEPSIHEPRPEGGRFPSDIDIQRRRSLRSATSGASDQSLSAGVGIVKPQESFPVGPGGEYDEQEFNAFATGRPGLQRNPSAFSYDAKYPPTSTLHNEEHFEPVLANIPPEIERRMPKQVDSHDLLERRDSTKSWTRNTPSRKPTATYGIDPVTGHPDPSPIQSTGYTSRQEEFSENTQSSLAAYEAGAATGVAGAGAYEIYRTAQASSETSRQEAVPRGVTSVDVTNPAKLTDAPFIPAQVEGEAPQRPTKSYGDLQALGREPPITPTQRTNSSFTISDFHVPGGYPK
ncbi:hypothetical protein H072_2576 [Dactylellina haptotyla CBS 200.50]|uniref:PH domain-containing protein n=1 Tax=Dactylellina haptotyla (strain CBS 200.50) TaxID=1284197 RepID=S8C6V8_DACHA|nr:hypothetical protein H072_2576 [Dactylellina haptotyla CBS 200.50]